MSRTILTVEDSPEERDIFSRYLKFVGGRLLEATNGEDGLRMAREHRPDLILLDLSMPVMDGWETIRRLNQDPATANIPVVAVTGHHLARRSLEEKGFCGYLEKPLAPYRILEEIERCLGPQALSRDVAPDRAPRRARAGPDSIGWGDEPIRAGRYALQVVPAS